MKHSHAPGRLVVAASVSLTLITVTHLSFADSGASNGWPKNAETRIESPPGPCFAIGEAFYR
jgi:hypothetical protein